MRTALLRNDERVSAGVTKDAARAGALRRVVDGAYAEIPHARAIERTIGDKTAVDADVLAEQAAGGPAVEGAARRLAISVGDRARPTSVRFTRARGNSVEAVGECCDH